MTFLKNKRAWQRFMRAPGYQNIVNTKEAPKEFPCFVYTVCESYNYEEDRALYLYSQDIQKMRNQLEGGK